MTHAILAAHGYTTQFIEGLLDFLKDINAARKTRNAIKETEKSLLALSNKDLADIGIARCDIYAIARKESVIEHCMKSNPNLKGFV